MVTLNINWAHPHAVGKNIPLNGAFIDVTDEKGNLLKQEQIKDGKVSLPSLADNSNFKVKIIAIYDDYFKIFDHRNATAEPSFTLAYKDINKLDEAFRDKVYGFTDDKNGQYTLNITHDEMKTGNEVWSVFQAMVELTRIANEQLNVSFKGKNRAIYLNAGDTLYGKSSDDSLNFTNQSYFSWNTIAHEFSHAILHESESLSTMSGRHNGENQYDYVNFKYIPSTKIPSIQELEDKLKELSVESDNENNERLNLEKSLERVQELEPNETNEKAINYYNQQITECKETIAKLSAEIEIVKKDLHQEKNQVDPAVVREYCNPGFKHKENAMSIAFGEGCASWLGAALLTYSNYRDGANKINNIGTSKFIESISADGKIFTDERDLDEVIDPLYDENYYGEDSEWAIARLLWNITNKKNGEFVRAHKGEKNQINIPLKTLFAEVFLGNGLSDIQSLRRYLKRHLKLFVWLSDFPLHNEEWKKGVNDLNYLFAEFGMVPYMEDADIKNTIRWTQYKTGSLPPGRITLYMENVVYGKLRVMEEESLYGGPTIGTKRIEEDKVIYEYKLTPGHLIGMRKRFRGLLNEFDWGIDGDGKKIRIPIIDEEAKITVAVEIGNCPSNIRTLPYKPLNPVSKKDVLEINLPDDAVIYQDRGYDSIYGYVAKQLHKQSYGSDNYPSGTFGSYFMRTNSGMVNRNIATLDYVGWEGYEDLIPQFRVNYYLKGRHYEYYGDSAYNRYDFYQHDLG